MAKTTKQETVVEEMEVAEVMTEEVSGTSEKVFDAEAKKWGKELAKEKKVKIKIKSRGKKDISPVPVGINGYFFWINKNETVEVPETVADLLREADYI